MPSRVGSRLKLGSEVRIRRVDLFVFGVTVASVNVGCVYCLVGLDVRFDNRRHEKFMISHSVERYLQTYPKKICLQLTLDDIFFPDPSPPGSIAIMVVYIQVISIVQRYSTMEATARIL